MVEFKKQGIDLFVAESATIKHPDKIIIGDHVALDERIYLSTGASIGDYVHIAPNVCIIGGSESHLFMNDFSGIAANSTIVCGSDDFTKGMMNPQVPIKYRHPKISHVLLKRFACIGVNCSVMPGVVMAEGSVLGANSLLMENTKPWGIYVGSPAKIIGTRNKEEILKGAKELGYDG